MQEKNKIVLELNDYEARNLHWLLTMSIKVGCVKNTDHYLYLYNGDWNDTVLYKLEQKMDQYEKENGVIDSGSNEKYVNETRQWREGSINHYKVENV